MESLVPVMERHPEFREAKILERIVEPERAIMFRVPWMDDKGEIHIQKGYRIEFNSAIGPYKGGLRFHPSVNIGILKFLGFEQVFKNSLTTLPMGGGKGGCDFDPKGKSDDEVMRFCQCFMSELFRHIGRHGRPRRRHRRGRPRDRLHVRPVQEARNHFDGVLTGKGLNWGGILIRPEATGYGCVYFAAGVARHPRRQLQGQDRAGLRLGQRRAVRGREGHHLGGKVVTLSDSDGLHPRPGGIDAREARLRPRSQERQARPHRRVRQASSKAKFIATTQAGPTRCGTSRCDAAFPSATQNEINAKDAETLLKNGCICVAEGANMPTAPEASSVPRKKALYGPGKAANAGGVATSGLEMSQNAAPDWSREEVDRTCTTS